MITNRTHAMSGWLQVMTPDSSVGLFVIVLQVLIQPDKSSSLRISHHLPMRIPAAKPIYQGHHGPIVLARLEIHWLIDAQILRSSAHFRTLVLFLLPWMRKPPSDWPLARGQCMDSLPHCTHRFILNDQNRNCYFLLKTLHAYLTSTLCDSHMSLVICTRFYRVRIGLAYVLAQWSEGVHNRFFPKDVSSQGSSEDCWRISHHTYPTHIQHITHIPHISIPNVSHPYVSHQHVSIQKVVIRIPPITTHIPYISSTSHISHTYPFQTYPFQTYPTNTYPTNMYPFNNTYPTNTYPCYAYPFQSGASAGIANVSHQYVSSTRIPPVRIHSKSLHQQEWQ